jgi:hypothetical protein
MVSSVTEALPWTLGQRLSPAFNVLAVVPKANAPKKNDKAFEGLTIHPVERIEEAMELVRRLD